MKKIDEANNAAMHLKPSTDDKFTEQMAPAEADELVQARNRSILEMLHEDWRRQLREDDAKLYIQLRHYIPAKLGHANNEEPNKRVDGITEMRTFLEGESPALLLLGDSGAGKSLFCQSLVDELWRNQVGWIPLFIHLPLMGLRPEFTFETYLREKCRLSFEQMDFFKISKSKILLILDAYDEMQEEHRGKNFYQELELHKWNIKVIISCRSEALVNYNLVKQEAMFTPTKIGFPAIPIERRYVQFFDTSQIPLYIQRWKELQKELNPELDIQEMDYFTEINKLPGLAVMATNPFILWAVMEVLPDLLKHYASQSVLPRYDNTRKALFDRFAQGWFERQRDKLLRNRRINAEWGATIVEDFHNYCQKLADYMWQINVTSLTYEQGQPVAPNVHSSNLLDKFFSQYGNFNDVPDRPLSTIRQGALLRVFGGNTYTFLHQSLMEYFSARRMFESAIHKITIVLGLEINMRLIINNLPTIRFGVDCVLHTPDFEEALWGIIEESKLEERVATAAANAITILVAANRSFIGKDLRRIRIRYANLSGGNFDGANFEGADLRDVNLSQAWLQRANLSGTCVDGLLVRDLSWGRLQENIVATAFSLNNQYYIVVTKTSVKVYETKNRAIYMICSPKLNWQDYLSAFVFATDSSFILLGTIKGEMLALSFPQGDVLRRWVGHKSEINILILSKDGKWALSGAVDSTIKQWSKIESEYRLEAMWKHSTQVTALALSSDGEIVLSASRGGEIKVLRYSTGISHLESGLSGSVLAQSSDGRWLFVSGGDDGTKIYKLRFSRFSVEVAFKWCAHKVTLLVVSSDGRWVLSGSSDNIIRLWNSEKGECVKIWSVDTAPVALAISSDGRYGILGFQDNTIAYFNWRGNENSMMWDRHAGSVSSMVFSAYGRWVFSGSEDGSIIQWDSATGECLMKWQGHAAKVKLLVMCKDDKAILSSSNDGTIKKWKCYDGSCIETLNARGVKALLPSKDHAGLLVLERNQRIDAMNRRDKCTTIKLWHLWLDDDFKVYDDVDERKLDKVHKKWFSLTSEEIPSSFFVISKSMIPNALFTKPVVYSDDSCVLFVDVHYNINRWDTNTQKSVAIWQGHSTIVCALVLSPNDQWAISSDYSGAVIVWRVSDGHECGRYLFDYPVLKLIWSIRDPSLVMMGMSGGTVSSWLFKADTCTLHLRWRSSPWALQATGSQLLNIHSEDGETFSEQRLFERLGAKVQLSSKSSKRILAQGSLLTPYVIGETRRSFFDNSIIIRPSVVVITVARCKTGSHAFMIIENVEEVSAGVSYYRIRRIDFVLELRHSALPKGASEPHAADTFGQGLIEIADKSFEEAQLLAQECYHITEAVNFTTGHKLLQSIYEDKRNKRIAYCKMGSGALYRLFTLREAVEHHNCLSWIRKHLEAIGVDLVQGKLKDFFVEDPRDKLIPVAREPNV